MAVRGFFYNSVNKDRKYNGKDMNEDKAPFYKEGVALGHLQVTADGETMAVKVDGGTRTGYAYINLHTVHNTTILELPVSGANGSLPRIDRVVLRNDETERKADIFILEGAYSLSPQPQELTNNETIQEKCLAEIYVAAGAVAITQADISDTRADTGLCGFIASQFEDIDFEQFSKQFNTWFAIEKQNIEKDHADFIEEYTDLTQSFMKDQAEAWSDWFNNKKDELSGDTAGKLQLQIDTEIEERQKNDEQIYKDMNYKDITELDIYSVRTQQGTMGSFYVASKEILTDDQYVQAKKDLTYTDMDLNVWTALEKGFYIVNNVITLTDVNSGDIYYSGTYIKITQTIGQKVNELNSSINEIKKHIGL